MQTQSFLLQDPGVLEKPNELTTELEARHQLLNEVGFHAVHQWEKTGEDRLFAANTLYPEMTGKQFRLWRSFLPTERSFENYRFDTPPTEALEAIQTAKQLGCFDRIEIWTPEGNDFLGFFMRRFESLQDKAREFGDRIDPMAVGIIRDINGQEHYYQIVRWGEALKPLKKIKRHVRSVNWRMRLLFVLLPALVAVAAIACYTAGILLVGFWTMLMWTAISIVACVVLLVLMAATVDDW